MKRQSLKLDVKNNAIVKIKISANKETAIASHVNGGTIRIKGTKNGNK